jgi:hypothetical protein
LPSKYIHYRRSFYTEEYCVLVFKVRVKILNSLTQVVDIQFEDVTGFILTAMNIADFKMWPSKAEPQPVWNVFGEVEVRDICK